MPKTGRSQKRDPARRKRRRVRKARLGARFERALVYASRLHAKQTKKGSGRPYVGHLLGVSALVIAHGGDEDEAVAALLHDAVEDQGGLPTLGAIRRKFGRRVAAIVEGCSDSFTKPKPPWKQRKAAYIAHVRHAPADVRLVSAADKLDNVRAIVTDLRLVGDDVWKRFSGGKEGSLWYYREMYETLKAAGSNPLVEDLGRAVAQMEHLAARRSKRKSASRKQRRNARKRR